MNSRQPEKAVPLNSKNPMAVIGFVLALAGFISCGLTFIPAFVLCIIGVRYKGHKKLAWIGLVVSGVGFCILLLPCACLFSFFSDLVQGPSGYEITLDGNDFIAISAGWSHSLALKSDGSIVGWGDNRWGMAEPPDGNDFVAIAAGTYFGLALKSDGSIIGWGRNTFGQTNTPDGNDFIAIAASPGSDHGLALKSDGSIVGWGNRGPRAWDHGEARPPAGNDFVAIAAGFSHSLALKSDGSIFGWGDNGFLQALPPDGNDFVAIAAGFSHSLALRSDGSIVCWGYKSDSQNNPPDGNDFVAIAAGDRHSLALKSDGSIVGWGDKKWFRQARPPDGNDFVAIAAGKYHSLALKSDGSIVGWGDKLNMKKPVLSIQEPKEETKEQVKEDITYTLLLKKVQEDNQNLIASKDNNNLSLIQDIIQTNKLNLEVEDYNNIEKGPDLCYYSKSTKKAVTIIDVTKRDEKSYYISYYMGPEGGASKEIHLEKRNGNWTVVNDDGMWNVK